MLKCKNCKFIWQKYSLNEKLQITLYDKLISSAKSKRKSDDSIEYIKERSNSEFSFFENILNKKNFKVLDYGAGWGSWILSLKYNLKNIFAFETSKKRVNYLKIKKINVINFKDIKKKKYKFDLIRLEQVLEHIDNFNQIVRDLKKILNKDGLVYMSVPNSNILFKKKWFNSLLIKGPAQPLEHINSFTNNSLNKLLQKYDYKKNFIYCFSKVDNKKKKDFSTRTVKTAVRIIFNNFYSTSILFKNNFMCGINGFNFQDDDLIKKMMSITKNRGPDFSNFFSSKDITLGHDRLSILDLNPRSHQPYKFKHFTISFNGEIYNYKQLKKELIEVGYKFKTTSDTEVIIYLFDKFGIESFKKLSGIFAISLWDAREKRLYLIRDIVGVKPLYYYFDNNRKKLIFSSSIRAIRQFENVSKINPNALFFYKNIGRNDSNNTFFNGIKKLLPGQLLICNKDKNFKLINFLNFNFSKEKANISKRSICEIIESQFISDVPVSLSLSGGYDSNIIYYSMRNFLEKKNYSLYSFYFHDYDKFNTDYNIAKKIVNFLEMN